LRTSGVFVQVGREAEMSDELKPQTAEESWIASGHPEFAETMAKLCTVPAVQRVLASADGDASMLIVVKSGLLLGFEIGKHYAKSGTLENLT
jgi:hypothetical protein